MPVKTRRNTPSAFISRAGAAVFASTACAEVSADLLVYSFPVDGTAGIQTPAFGSGLVTYDTDTMIVTWDIEYLAFVGEIFAAHFHGPTTPGGMAAVRLNLSDTIVPIDSSRGRIAGSALLDASQATELTTGLWYVNMHTDFALAGEARGHVLDAPPCFADLDGSNDVGFADLLTVIGAWGPCGATTGGTGACCSLNGVCTDGVTDALCVSFGAFYQGDGSQCSDNAVDCGRTCAPDLDGSGDVGFGDVLRVIGAWGECG